MPSKKGSKRKQPWRNKRVPLHYLWPVALTVALLLIFSIFNLWSLFQIRKQVTANLELIKQEIVSLSPSSEQKVYVDSTGNTFQINPDGQVVALISNDYPEFAPISGGALAGQSGLSGRLTSFGDNFSGLGYIDEANSNMYWDENVTAFTFPPEVEVKKVSDCSEDFCGFSLASVDPQSICLPAGCLSKTSENIILFNNQPLKLPPALAGQVINSVTLGSFDNFWVIGLTTGPSQAERGWVFRFDGLAYSPLITDTTEYQILPRYERGGGRIAFGGTADDFIVLYAGYDGQAFRFRDGNVENISKYFGLRVTAGGFMPQILKTSTGQDSIFYICSVSNRKPKIMKLWSSEATRTSGALDLSPLIFSLTSGWRPEQIICAMSDASLNELAVAARRNNAYAMYSLTDMGFNQSMTRQVTSVNLNNKLQETIVAAIIADIGIETQAGSLADSVKAYIGNAAGSMEEVQPYAWHTFKELGSELYWRLEMSPTANAFYSPWLDHINRLDYRFLD